jgi:ATP-dependent Lon protease
MMPIRDVVIFPYMMTPFVVGRESSVRALEEALAADKKIFLATQHDASVDEPKPNEIYQVGTIVNIVQSLKLPDGNIKVLVEGIERGKILQVTETEGFMQASVRVARYTVETSPQLETAMQRVTGLFEQYVKLCQSLNYETMIAAVRMEDPAKLTDTIAANLQLSIEEKQELLEIFDPAERLNRIGDVLDIEIEKLNMDRTIQSRVKRQMERAQKEYYLNEKIKAIQKELGRGEKSLRRRWIPPACPRKSARRPCRSSRSSRPCLRCRPSPPSPAITWTGCWRCRGRSAPKRFATSAALRRCSMKTTMAWKRSRSASSSFWPCGNW